MSSSQQKYTSDLVENERLKTGPELGENSPNTQKPLAPPSTLESKPIQQQPTSGSSTTQSNIESPIQPTQEIEKIDIKDQEKVEGMEENEPLRPLTPPSEIFLGKKRTELIPDLREMSIDVGNYTYRLPSFKEHLLQTSDPEVRTVFDSWLKTVYENGNKRAFGYRRLQENGKLDSMYTWLTYKDAEERIQVITSGLINLGIRNGTVGILCENRVEWQLVNQAVARVKDLHLVPFNSRWTQTELDSIVIHSEVPIVFCSRKYLHMILKTAQFVPNLKTIVCFDHFTVEQQQQIQEPQYERLSVLSYYDLLRAGRQKLRQDFPFPKSDDVLLISYTSGTTGNPKAVILTHGNIIATTSSLRLFWNQREGDQKFISFLPLSHVLQYVAEQVMIEYGIGIGYWSDDINKLHEDISILSPTLMTSVPRTAEKLELIIKKNIKKTNPILRTILKPGKKKSGTKSFMGRMWDKYILNKVKEKSGLENLQGILSGGAPLNDETQSFLQNIFNIPVIQGYGLTETCAGGAMQLPNDINKMRVGAPLACNELRLRSVEDLGYNVTDNLPRGELLIRGYNISPGYFKDELLTNEKFLKDGFFCTGDVAQRNEDGSFSIIDRTKNILKLSQGEYVPIEYLQNLYKQSKLVNNIWLYGDPNHSQLIAIVYPVGKVGEKKLIKSFDEIAKEHNLKGFEYVKGVCIVKKDFKEIDPDLETSSGQLRREKMERHFIQDIEKIYRKISHK